ncbi:DNA-directed RNA polymerase subunit delta [Bacillus alkalicellulosilyticus]|uniref:DNA-directed RNA polymerase subunit delta n=1 Tax=Alkalihalobacterium alkalicellulosilyticum TaxID=1912214 RepID=UPI000997BED8|nr:DNA-directed RNA polymerase subunit delta [Bacillus alkalicellulosilyticus]
MSIKAYGHEELKEMSMIEIAYEVMKEEKNPFTYNDLLKRVADLKGMSNEDVTNRIGALYTDLNIDGRFLCVGANTWGLRSWYPVEKVEEDFTVAPTKPARKKAKAADEDIEEYEEYEDEFEELEDELDEISAEDDSDEFESEDLDGFEEDSDEEDSDLEDDDFEEDDTLED